VRGKVYVLPRSLRSVADVRAARTQEKIGHSGRDDGAERRPEKTRTLNGAACGTQLHLGVKRVLPKTHT
jgi:hypothetical protein